MSRHLRDLLTLLDHAIYEDDYGVPGSTFYVCRYCESESGAGVLMKPDWHAPNCPVPRMQRKYAGRGQQRQAIAGYDPLEGTGDGGPHEARLLKQRKESANG